MGKQRRRTWFVLACAIFFCSCGVATQPAFAVSDDDCFMCHSDPEIQDEAYRSLYVNPDEFAESVHGESGIECTMCHEDLAEVEDFPHAKDVDPVNCAMCHDEEMEDYAESVHGQSRERGDLDVATCVSCHGTHYVRRKDDRLSLIYPTNVPKTCSICHTDEDIVTNHNLPDGVEFVKNYMESIHGIGVSEMGLTVTAVCNDCHGAHDIRDITDPASSVSRRNIPRVCAKCHDGIFQSYIEGVHGQDYLHGIKDVPVCTDCHGEHTIKSHLDPDSSVYATHVADVCSRCHDDERLAREYGFASKRLKTYLGTFHGVASGFGDASVANCASCHGFHDIRPSSDPKSSINIKNLPKTCGKCHPQAGENFAKGKVHVTDIKESNIGAYWVRNFYRLLITVIIGGFLVFIAADLVSRFVRSRRRKV